MCSCIHLRPHRQHTVDLLLTPTRQRQETCCQKQPQQAEVSTSHAPKRDNMISHGRQAPNSGEVYGQLAESAYVVEVGFRPQEL